MIDATDLRARAVLALAPRVECVAATTGLRVYAVPSRTEDGPRLVRVFGNGAARCDCKAGQHQRACVHVAATLLARSRSDSSRHRSAA